MIADSNAYKMPSCNNLFVRSNEEHGNYEYVLVSTYTYIQIAKSRLATNDVAGFKTWLVSNPVTIIYKLATPTETKLSQSSIYNLRSFDEVTYIEVLDDVSPELTVDVAKTPEGGYLLEGFCNASKANSLTK